MQGELGMTVRRVVWPVVGALVVLGAVADPAAAGTSLTGVSSEPCVGEVASEGAATLEAVRCGRAVEVLDSRTAWNTLEALPDGTMRLKVSAAAVRAQVDGQWVGIDRSIVEGGEAFTVAAPVTQMEFSKGGDGPLVQMSGDGHDLTFAVPFDLPKPEVTGDAQLTYPSVLPGVDLIVTVNADATGFSEVLRVASPQAAANPDLKKLTFPLELSEGLTAEPSLGGFAVKDAQGEQAFASPAPQMWDSRGAEQSLDVSAPRALGLRAAASPLATLVDEVAAPVDRTAAPTGTESVAVMPVEVADDAVTITPDAQLLSDPATVWPVYIDPEIRRGVSDWTAVRDGYSQDYRFSPDQGVGICNKADPYGSSCSKTFKSRLMWIFGGLEPIQNINPAWILSASFQAVGTHSYSCTPKDVSLYRIDGWNSSSAWPGSSFWGLQSTITVAHKSSCSAQPVRWVGWDATESARAVATVHANALALGLAANESSMAYWHRYRNDAVYVVNYNNPPTTPQSTWFSAPQRVCTMGADRPLMNTPSPVISAIFSDPDGDAVVANADVYRTADGALLYSGLRTAAQASGLWQSITLPALPDGVYTVALSALDTYGWQSGGMWCEYVIDTVAPAVPSVTPVAGQPGVYAEGLASGGIGRRGDFALAGGPDVAYLRYAFDGATLQSLGASSGTVSFTPGNTADHWLDVVAVDAAGNVSGTRHYVFKVDSTRYVAWRLDEGAGASSAASSERNGPDSVPAPAFGLGLTSGTAWTTGVLAELAGTPSDKALLFDTAGDLASTSVPVVKTSSDFWVNAVVKPSSVAGAMTAVSQDGSAVSGFQLGTQPCASGVGMCWAFLQRNADSTSAATSTVLSTVAVSVGHWTDLLAVRSGGTLKLYTCDSESDDPVRVLAGSATAGGAWDATGGFRVGSARTGVNQWYGAIGDVRAGDGFVDPSLADKWCHGGLGLA